MTSGEALNLMSHKVGDNKSYGEEGERKGEREIERDREREKERDRER